MLITEVHKAISDKFCSSGGLGDDATALNVIDFIIDLEETVKLARPFTKGDWEGLAGAEAWRVKPKLFSAPGPKYIEDEPVIREFPNFCVVCDKSGVQLITADAKSWYSLPEVKFPCQACALAFLNGLPDNFKPGDLGFTEAP